jgi:toxin ParE1/3/4
VKVRKIVFRPRADNDLFDLYRYIAEQSGSNDIAFSYMEKLRKLCLALSEFSERGAPRSDIVPGLRILPYEGRAVVAYFVVEDRVEIAAVYYGGQDWETLARENNP